jgi:hypothetical protein
VTELERKHLVETDRHIAECKNYIAKQRELIERPHKALGYRSPREFIAAHGSS